MLKIREVKMVMLFATAVAVGIGAAAACVVPWFYCKSTEENGESLYRFSLLINYFVR